jgi:hypothetical protein
LAIDFGADGTVVRGRRDAANVRSHDRSATGSTEPGAWNTSLEFAAFVDPPLLTLLREFVRGGFRSELRSRVIAVPPPSFDHALRIIHRSGVGDVQAIVPQPAVEGFDVRFRSAFRGG